MIGKIKKETHLHARRRQGQELLLHTVRNTREHGGTTGEDNVAVEITTNIEITLEDRVVRRLVDTGSFESEERGLEERFGGTESGGMDESGREKSVKNGGLA